MDNEKVWEIHADDEENKPILCLDFDGVCHSYTSGWQGETRIPDEPVAGLFEVLERATPHFDIQIYSTRSKTAMGRAAMLSWFFNERAEWRKTKNGRGASEVLTISFPETKPPAFITLDDRVLTFKGKWPSVDDMLSFKPWYK